MKEYLNLTVGGTTGESNIANLWKDHFSAIANSVGSTDNRDQVMNALRTVPGHNDVINVHELRQIVGGLENNKAVGNDGIPSEVYKFASERLLTMMSIFLSACMLTGKLPSTLMHVVKVIIPVLKCKSKDMSDITITDQLQLLQLSPRYSSWSCWRDSFCTQADNGFLLESGHTCVHAVLSCCKKFI